LDAYLGDPENDKGGDIEIKTDGPSPRVPLPVSVSRVQSSNGRFILGSYQGIRTIRELLKREGDTDVAFTSFCARLSVAVKGLNPTDAIVIDESHSVCLILISQLTSVSHPHLNHHHPDIRIPIPQMRLPINGRLVFKGGPFAL
jgi:hypothetical protein